MKKLIKDDIFNLDVVIHYAVSRSSEIAATTISPIVIDDINQTIDQEARNDFVLFVQNVFEIIQCYDFEIIDDFKHSSKSFPQTSEYMWIAHRTELDADSVPKYIHLRISDHIQSFSDAMNTKLSKRYRDQAEAIKKPTSKKKQRYELQEIVVNNSTCSTYEEALHQVELKVRKWLSSKGIDVNQYGPMIW